MSPSTIGVCRITGDQPNADPLDSLPQVWGDDAHEWNPTRFIDGHPNIQIRLGMFGNL